MDHFLEQIEGLSEAVGASGTPAPIVDQSPYRIITADRDADLRLSLFSRDGSISWPLILDGSFHIEGDTLPDLQSFAHAVLVDGKEGLFIEHDGSQTGMIGYGLKGPNAAGYQLEPKLAEAIGIEANGGVTLKSLVRSNT
ncbi:hypothetical protein [Croceicoccus sp. Ery15]|uniref:hypothetical protein n=1 Tax=Croceicoccus sp. Ery15 TaxID=1703338 RepID=UPI001E50725A|nr:hypothetical protein [Croceicoccus sp. Ery15]